MVIDGSRGAVLGRGKEIRLLDGMLRDVRSGRSAVFVVRGEPGIGKSTLVEGLVESATEFQTLRAHGVDSEMELPFAGLHQLCSPLLDRLPALPEPQRDALGTVFGLHQGSPPDRFLVGLATLTLVSEAAERGPVFCVVDDAQWLDRASAQTMAFVARRLLADRVGLVFATREPDPDLAGFPELVVSGLQPAEARALLASRPGAPLDKQVQDRIVEEAHGNPLALLEWRRALTAAPTARGVIPPRSGPLSERIEERFRQQLEQLPPATRQFLLVAAAEPVGDSALVRRAAGRLGVDAASALPAVDAELIEIGATLRFRHPLIRTAAYQASPLAERQRAHRALAEATDVDADPDRRAWHRALSTSEPDEDVAEELERSATRAQARGGSAAAAAFLERAAALTADPALRFGRDLAAARAFHNCGDLDAATRLTTTAEALARDDVDHANVAYLRGTIAYASGEFADAPRLLLKAASPLEVIDSQEARRLYLLAVNYAVFAGRLASGCNAPDVARSVRAAAWPVHEETAVDLFLDGFTTFVLDGPTLAVPVLNRAIARFRNSGLDMQEDGPNRHNAPAAALVCWDDQQWNDLTRHNVSVIRTNASFGFLASTLNSLAYLHLMQGDLSLASSAVAEAEAINDVTGSHYAPYHAAHLAALRGHEADARAVIQRTIDRALVSGQGLAYRCALSATATLFNGLGRYPDALAAADEAAEHPPDWWSDKALPELIEAAVRCGEPQRATSAVERLLDATTAASTDWALGVAARTRALLADKDRAEPLYQEAVERLARTSIRTELARAHLLYGEWLRREGRRSEAREQLRTAHEMLSSMGVGAFAERARRELMATGETVRKRTVETATELTAQEASIARLAVDGLTNPEIATQLFLSSRTVEYHLGKVFSKLGIGSRRELRMVRSSLEVL
jgi:DNA-binding CsgD family transcriptional regulator